MALSASATLKEKDKEEEIEDRFDCLPDDILHQILFCFIDTREALRHCILVSRRWSEVCKTLPFLFFDRSSFPQEEEDDHSFINFVDMVLIHRDDSPIVTFSLDWSSPSQDDIVIRNTHRWIHAALRRKVQDLSVDMGCINHFTYQFSHQLLNSKSLRKLQVTLFCVTGYAEIVLSDRINLPNIEYLWLACLSISNEVLTRRLLSSCPLLNTLEIHDCDLRTDNRRYLTVDSPKLQNFELVHLFPHALLRDHTMPQVINLSAPNLQEFSCRSFFRQEYSLENRSPLSDVSIEMVLEDDEDVETPLNLPAETTEVFAKRVLQFIRAVYNIKCLKLSSGIIGVLSRVPDIPDCQLLSLRDLQCLKIEMLFRRSSFRGLVYLLKMSPNINSIFLISEESKADAGDKWEEGMLFPGMLSHLKFVQIEEVEGCDSELRVLGFLLSKATVLMSVNLIFCSFVGSTEMEHFVDTVRGLPTASPIVRITNKQETRKPKLRWKTSTLPLRNHLSSCFLAFFF